MTREDMIDVLADVECGEYHFKVVEMNTAAGHCYLQAIYYETDVYQSNPAGPADDIQTTRKWLLSEHMTRSELLQTALKCVLTSAEHRVREKFTYKRVRLYGPHIDCDELVKIAGHTSTRLEPAPAL